MILVRTHRVVLAVHTAVLTKIPQTISREQGQLKIVRDDGMCYINAAKAAQRGVEAYDRVRRNSRGIPLNDTVAQQAPSPQT